MIRFIRRFIPPEYVEYRGVRYPLTEEERHTWFGRVLNTHIQEVMVWIGQREIKVLRKLRLWHD